MISSRPTNLSDARAFEAQDGTSCSGGRPCAPAGAFLDLEARGPRTVGAAVRLAADDSLFARVEACVAAGMSLRQAALACGISLARAHRLANRASASSGARRGRPPKLEYPFWFVPVARFFWLLINRTSESGSVPEAVRRTVSLPECPGHLRARLLKVVAAARLSSGERPDADPTQLPSCPAEIREEVVRRGRAGQPLVPERIARQIRSSGAAVVQQRSPRRADLDYFCSPGSMPWITDRATGQRRPIATGEVVEADDATINFPVCVPWELGGDPCSDRWGYKVGRFQWLVCLDARSRFVTAWSYVMRARSSYRAEDTLALMHAHCRAHGVPGFWRFEQGVWKSNLVRWAVERMGSELWTVYSPHQKPYIENLFNTLWTKLSVHFPESEVGRFMGENEEANRLLTACQRGAENPLNHFPTLEQALGAFTAVVAEKNQTPVQADTGRWVPAELWSSATGARLLNPQTAWIFSPYAREWTVRGMLVGGRVRLFEDLAVPFDFSAPWLAQWHGCKVRVHFDPSAPRCEGMVVLAEDARGAQAGTVLGAAEQINEIAGYARLVLGWGQDPSTAGRLARQRAAAALRREVRSVVPAGRGSAESLERDGINVITRVERDADAPGARRSAQAPEMARVAGVVPLSRPAAEDPRLAEFLEEQTV